MHIRNKLKEIKKRNRFSFFSLSFSGLQFNNSIEHFSEDIYIYFVGYMLIELISINYRNGKLIGIKSLDFELNRFALFIQEYSKQTNKKNILRKTEIISTILHKSISPLCHTNSIDRVGLLLSYPLHIHTLFLSICLSVDRSVFRYHTRKAACITTHIYFIFRNRRMSTIMNEQNKKKKQYDPNI